MPRTIRTRMAVAMSLLLGACGSFAIFPPEVLKDVDPTFEFNAWRASPNANEGRKVQLGGRIIQAEADGDGVLIVGEQMPIVDRPIYGPAGSKKRFGAFEFAFFYPGKIEPTALTPGNRFILVGNTQRTRVVSVEGASKTQAYLIAECVHIWKTGEREISDFPDVGAGYYPLESNTYCRSRP